VKRALAVFSQRGRGSGRKRAAQSATLQTEGELDGGVGRARATAAACLAAAREAVGITCKRGAKAMR